MDIFEYLPQLIVAYDSEDEFANLIHVKKADKDKDYYCPCCGGSVKPRALESNKEQSHYYHKTGKCTKESQLHFFCKNWLFEKGSKFYINKELFEVVSIEIEKTQATPFGDYRPDITVHTSSGKTVYFEIFFSNRKTGDDYFCKWDALGNDVVEVNIKEFMFKTDKSIVPTFTYLYHNGLCYSKTYEKRDLYATTIARIKRDLTRQNVLNYKARIEQLDWFWEKIRSNETRESILKTIESMEYDDMISCYSIIKRKQCVSYLRNDVLDLINQKVLADVRKTLDLPQDDNIYFDLRHIRGRTYEAGIRLNVKTQHITYNILHASLNCWYRFDKTKEFPKVVFSKNVFRKEELSIPENEISKLNKLFYWTANYRDKILKYEELLSELEDEKYRIRVKNNFHTVLIKSEDNSFKVLFENYYLQDFNITDLKDVITCKISDIENKKFLDTIINSSEYKSFLIKLKSYSDFNVYVDICKHLGHDKNGLQFKLYIDKKCIFNEDLKRSFEDFLNIVNKCESLIQNYVESYSVIIDLVNLLNNCKNNYWKAQFSFDIYGYPTIEVDQKYFTSKKYLTLERIRLDNLNKLNKQDVIPLLESGMHNVLKNMERCGYRVMEESI